MRTARKNLKRVTSTPSNVAKILLAALVLVAFLASAFPLATLASGQMCNLACCAGRAPHAAGSCMDGSCHAALANRSRARRYRRTVVQSSEQLCGLARPKSLNKWSTAIAAKQASQRSETSLAPTNLSKPCESDCGTCSVSSFSSRNRQRMFAALAFTSKPRPPSAAGRFDANSLVTSRRAALCNRSIPRGPPFSFS